MLKLEDMPDPQPRDGEVLVRVRAAGVNPVDGYIRSGAHARKAVAARKWRPVKRSAGDQPAK